MHDPRFIYVRNAKNGGPYNARTVGWKMSRGDYVVNVDSDWEAFPWMLERVVHYFGTTPGADAVTGMFLRSEDSRVFVRVRNGQRLVSPAEVESLPKIADCIAGVRHSVVDEWLKKSHGYFALEAHSWLAFSLAHSQLYVDEPWAAYHVDSSNRVTPLLGANPRFINDCLLFLADYDEVLRGVPRRDIDQMLTTVTRILLAHRHWEGVRTCLQYMRIRKMDARRAMLGIVLSGARTRLGLRRRAGKTDEVIWID
jgi:glycosyltransferase involved in cell wall biosynthesis